jgi:hypothetical protein
VALHDLENALSELVATMFWTSKLPLQSTDTVKSQTPILKVGHIPPAHQLQVGDYRLVEVEYPLVLLPGQNATATGQSLKIRLDVSLLRAQNRIPTQRTHS